MLPTLYFWFAVGVAGLITFSLFQCGETPESLASQKGASPWIAYTVLILCVLLWPLFLIFLVADMARK